MRHGRLDLVTLALDPALPAVFLGAAKLFDYLEKTGFQHTVGNHGIGQLLITCPSCARDDLPAAR